MTARDVSGSGDLWTEVANRMRDEVARRPYVTLLAGGGLGCLLAGGLALRVLPGLVDLGVRLVVATALPALARVATDPPSP